MSLQKRQKSKRYPGVYYRDDAMGKDRTYYIRYRLGGRGARQVEEPVGKSAAGMTEAKANQIRMDRMRGRELSNTERRRVDAVNKHSLKDRATIRSIWALYRDVNSGKPILKTDACLFKYLSKLHNKTPEEITTSDIDSLRKDLMSVVKERKGRGGTKPLASQTVKHILAFLRRLINFSVKRGMSSPQAHLHFEMPVVDNVKTEFLTNDQILRLKRVLDEEPDRLAAGFFMLALTTGMRKGALLGLLWQDVDFEKGFITLRGDTAKKGKTDIIPLSEASRSVLNEIPRSGSEYVFPGKNGGRRWDFRRAALRIKKKAALPDDFRPLHGLRHTFASLLASSGNVDLYTLQKLLTHSSPQMTQRYAHLADEAMKRAANVADSIFDDIVSQQEMELKK
ncbi:MAG TPA: site-specific integrase [Desulfovibrio sp.]|uniref:Site-specific integrase n=1 Tax=Nitratidesulfovibrio liaohensis TaxID=2604158 RepID=A0ABY9R040_9BACT|nr:site-specific integrase [Nitratidesulfovibrio liaohensis]WMW64512.1 site-specific integrase [Nitratidesulfovibrio liaohensis]HBW14620.1 site-specific integrase [Desulfovibrio sp.]